MVTKKGAIEFSMTTIMVVIIGVAVLALGLAWIRGTFSQVGDITEGALETAETVVGEVAFSGKISAPATINMGTNDAKKFRILIRDDGDGGTYGVTAYGVSGDCITLVGEDDTAGFNSVLVSGLVMRPNEIAEVGGAVQSGDCTTGSKQEIVRIAVSDGGAYTNDAIAVQVK